jgi:excinuclease ABC subunit A
MTDRRPARGPASRRSLRVTGASENNLQDLDLELAGGLTAVVGVSGSGKSSLVLDTVYHEARRRFLETLSLGSPWLRMAPARVRGVEGLGPAVALAQDVVNRNPGSTVATAAGIHPYLRVLFARLGRRTCPACGAETTVTSREGRLAVARRLLRSGPVELVVPLVRATPGTHARLLAFLGEQFGRDAVEVDGAPWTGGPLAPEPAHDVAVRVGDLPADAGARELRRRLEVAEILGSPQVTLRTGAGVARTLSRAPLCPGCGRRLPVLRPTDFRTGNPHVGQYRLGGYTLPELLALPVAAASALVATLELPPEARPAIEPVRRRLAALDAMELGYLPLDRPSPTLSRGEGQRVRLAVVLANRVEDLLHVLDEPSIGLDPGQVGRLLDQLARLPGPVVMVEHDRWAVARADEVVELGPGPGRHGGRVVFQGAPAALWRAGTVSGRWFSGRERSEPPAGRPPPDRRLTVRGASLHNLRGFDCDFPTGRLTVVSGPSGAGKTTLVRGVLLASVQAGAARGCRDVEGPRSRPVEVDQSPIGRNPRSNPATYTGLAGRIRAVFARATGLPSAAFSFNRPDGACSTCGGIGSVEITLPHLPSEWVTCEACQGRRFTDEVLDARAPLADGRPWNVAELYQATVEEAAALLEGDPAARRVLESLLEVGLGYLTLGQPSPSLSGGEAQRVKLAKWLSTARPGDLVVLDEPTTGLHPADLQRLLAVLQRLTGHGCTVVVVEHHPDVVAAGDWNLRLGPGAGPDGGMLLSAGPPAPSPAPPARPRRSPRPGRRSADRIRISGASANNLRGVSVELAKGMVTAIVGVSGSGKSSLLTDVLWAEAGRRLLECLSTYERQSVKEGPEAPVRSVTGLGPTVAIGPERRLWDPRSTVGTATELSYHLGVLLAYAGSRTCRRCAGVQRRTGPDPQAPWACRRCGEPGPPAAPAHFDPAAYEAACLTCHGLGTVQEPRPERLLVQPDAPLCKGAMHSPGFFPGSYLCKPPHGGYWMLKALGARYGFDPATTPWSSMGEDAQQAFLYGDPEPVTVPSGAKRSPTREVTWPGFFPIVEGWDLGGLYTEHVPCPACDGARLRPQYLEVRLAGRSRHGLHHDPVVAVERRLGRLRLPGGGPATVAGSLQVAVHRLRFLIQVGLGYLHLDRGSASLSAGEAQRVRLAALLGAGLTGQVVLLDEPSRGLHPTEVGAVREAVGQLRDAGNTVVLVDHDPGMVAGADRLVVLGPGAGRDGGRVVAAGPAGAVRRHRAARALVPGVAAAPAGRRRRREPSSWLVVRKPRAHNLTGEDVELPLGVVAGLCGVSGSGKSTLAVDIVGRALDPPRLTTSVAMEEVRPGDHEAIEGAPPRTVVSDQARSGIRSPGAFLGVSTALRRLYAASAEAAVLGLADKDLVPRCDGCAGSGRVKEDMGFLPDLRRPCEACDATGYHAEARELRLRGRTLPELEAVTLDQVLAVWDDQEAVARPLGKAVSLGLGYLVLGQPAEQLSGGEAQRLKLVKELARRTAGPTLYLLDEPSVGLHPADVDRLVTTLAALADAGHSVLVVEHDPLVLARCDRLVELGPGGGPRGGRVIAAGTPEQLAAGRTPTAAALREVLG